MHVPPPVQVTHLFGEERARLLQLLSGLSAQQWAHPTVCPDWSVKDIALHLLGDDLGLVSRGRDGFSEASPDPGEDLVAFVNRRNEAWVAATRRLSTAAVHDLLAVTGDWASTWLVSRDGRATGGPVSWAGPEPAPVWLDVAREYTERWHHQQQIRDAVGAPSLTDPHLFAPVLATFVHALARTFRAVQAPAGTSVHLRITGDAGGDWTVVREGDAWRLYEGAPDTPGARTTLGQDVAWRLFTRGMTPADVRTTAVLEGDPELAARVLETVSVIA